MLHLSLTSLKTALPSQADAIMVCNLRVGSLLPSPVTHLTEDWLHRYRLMSAWFATSASVLLMLHLSLTVLKTGSTVTG